MAFTFSDRIIQEIRRRTDIVELISAHVRLKKAGRNYVGLCPFHSEKTPSFTVSPEKQIFYCFGCGTGGDAVSFLMKMNSLSFPEAVRLLADRLGLTIKETTGKRSDQDRTDDIFHLNQVAAELYAEALFSPQGERARRYLEGRGIGEKTILQFQLGYAPDEWHWLSNRLKSAHLDLKLAIQAGLLISREKSGFYDRFRNRIMFPIHDNMQRIIAFGGRDLGEGTPKYLNSPESPVYTKGRSLYGLYTAREEIRRKDYVIVVEGYFDLLSLWEHGIFNTVATLGTALTEEHVNLIRRFTSHAVAVFDPDEAGKKALMRSLSLFLKGNVEMKVVVLPEGYDPDLFVRTFGAQKWQEEINRAKPAVEYYLDEVFRPTRGIQQERMKIKEAIAFIRQIESPIERHLFIRRIAQRLNIDEGVLEREIEGSVSPSPTEQMPKQELMEHTNDLLELKLIYLLLEESGFAKRLSKTDLSHLFSHADLKALASFIIDQNQQGGPLNINQVLERLDESRRRRIMTWAMEMEQAEKEKEFLFTIKRLREKWFERVSQNLNLQIRQAQERGDEALCRQLLAKKARLLKVQNTENVTAS